MNVNFGPGASAVDKEGYLNLYRRDSSSNQTKVGVFRSGIPVGGVRGAELWSYQALALVTSSGSGHIVFKPQGTERIRISSSSGNLLINGITELDTSHIAIHQHSNKNGITFKAPNTSSYMALQFQNNSGGRIGYIQYSNTATSYSTSSDYRLKENVVPMTGSIDRVKALKPSRFNFIVDADKTVDGFLAHEAQEIVPECATGTKDAMRDEEYEVTAAVEEVRDEDDNITTEAVEAVMGSRSVPDYQGIDQAKLVPLLVAALQEAITQIESLTGRIAALEE
jgi:hypothetical protein